MTRRFWIALAAGAAVGGGAVAGFAPYVRSQLEERARRYGAEITVAQVVPAVAGVRLRGLSLTVPEVPGVRVWIDELVVGWRERRPVSMSGGTIVAVGAVSQIVAAADKWQREHWTPQAGSGSGPRPLAVSGFALEWRSGPGELAQRVDAAGLSIAREHGRFTVAAESLRAEFAPLTVSIDDGRAVFGRGDGWRIHELASRALRLDYGADIAPSAATASSSAPALTDTPVASADPVAKAEPEGTASRPVGSRVLAARRFYAATTELAARIDAIVAPDAKVEVRGARARMVVRGQALELGPGTLGLGRDSSGLTVSLAPELAEARAERGHDAPEPLTFNAHLPIARAAGAGPPLWAELRGGPVWLSQLGLKDGDLGLHEVSRASLESDARIELSKDGESLRIDGRGKLHRLAIHHPRLAGSTVEGIELAWRGKIGVRLDGTAIELADTELDLGELRLWLSGRYQHRGSASANLFELANSLVDVRFEVPLTNCQTAFDSLPKALVPKLVGTRMAGSLAAKGHARFDTANVQKTFDVDWDGALSCRITEAPAEVRVASFKQAFRKVVYTPEGQEQWMTFGPGTEGWVPLGSVSKFMETGVLTCEDGRFHRHHGFDKEAIINSLRDNLAAGAFKRGASTISMQLAKNLYLTREKTLSRKMQEAVLTLYLEQELTKAEMLELYFNVIEYGPMIYGIGAAAQHYFHTGPNALSLGQSLYLASILQNPKKQFFGPGGAVIPARMSYLHRLMKLANKIHLVNDEDAQLGLRETVVFGQPEPTLAPTDEADPYGESAAMDGI